MHNFKKHPPGRHSSLWYDRRSQILRTSRSGALLPCLPSPSYVRQLRPTLGEDASDNTKKANQARRPPTPQDSSHKDKEKR